MRLRRTAAGLGLESELQGAFMTRGEVLGVGSHVGKGDSLRAWKMRREEKEAFLWVPGLEPRSSPLLCSVMLSLCSRGSSSPPVPAVKTAGHTQACGVGETRCVFNHEPKK